MASKKSPSSKAGTSHVSFFQGASNFRMPNPTFNTVQGDMHVHNQNSSVANHNSNNRTTSNTENVTNNTSNHHSQNVVFMPSSAGASGRMFGFVEDELKNPAPRRKAQRMKQAGLAIEAANQMASSQRTGNTATPKMIAATPANTNDLASQSVPQTSRKARQMEEVYAYRPSQSGRQTAYNAREFDPPPQPGFSSRGPGGRRGGTWGRGGARYPSSSPSSSLEGPRMFNTYMGNSSNRVEEYDSDGYDDAMDVDYQ
ncbi:hypothetical protein AX16_008968 [Volvariella volvacea WC 439]|nr:hypothetical protein AX16_008968 [Volvariella volvacea WC 439]